MICAVNQYEYAVLRMVVCNNMITFMVNLDVALHSKTSVYVISPRVNQKGLPPKRSVAFSKLTQTQIDEEEHRQRHVGKDHWS
jgi:hypothetical protein